MYILRANALMAGRQDGAREYVSPSTYLGEVRRYRLKRIQDELVRQDLAGIILYDQLNTRYATDSTNMQIWCSHNEARYVYVPANSGAIIFEYGGKSLLSEGLPGIARIQTPVSFFYMSAAPTVSEKAKEWAVAMDAIIREHSGSNRRIAIDRLAPLGVQEMESLGYEVHDGIGAILREEVSGLRRDYCPPGHAQTRGSGSVRCDLLKRAIW